MSRAIGLILAGVLAVGVVVAVIASVSGRFQPRPVVVVQGVIGSEWPTPARPARTWPRSAPT
jgi:hypothetical protein